MGLCYLAKGQPEQAIQSLRAGLEIPGQAADVYQSLRYDLGTALEAIGDLSQALQQYEILQAEGAQLRDLPARITSLHGRISQPPVAALTTPGLSRKKKISFI